VVRIASDDFGKMTSVEEQFNQGLRHLERLGDVELPPLAMQ
jgi:hypothetical protein